MFVLRFDAVSTPRDFWRTFSVIIVERGYKLLNNTPGTSSRLSSSGVRSPDYSPVPGGAALGLGEPAPRFQKDDSTFAASRTLALVAVSVGNAGSRCGENLDAGAPSRRGPAQAFSSIAAMYPVLASANCAGL